MCFFKKTRLTVPLGKEVECSKDLKTRNFFNEANEVRVKRDAVQCVFSRDKICKCDLYVNSAQNFARNQKKSIAIYISYNVLGET